MRVTFVKTKEIKEVNDSYGARLIEQGKAILSPLQSQAPEAAPEAEDSPKKKR